MAIMLNEQAGSVTLEQEPGILERMIGWFREHGIEAQVETVTPDLLADTVRQAAAGKWDALIAGGGDGTVSLLAGNLAGKNIPLGVLPLGTYNHFARDLNLPLELEEAIRSIAESKPRAVDLAEVNQHFFVNNSSIGIYPRAVAERETLRRQTGGGKRLLMVWAGIKVLMRRPLVRVRLEMEGKVTERTTPFVFVGNNCYTLGLREDKLRSVPGRRVFVRIRRPGHRDLGPGAAGVARFAQPAAEFRRTGFVAHRRTSHPYPQAAGARGPGRRSHAPPITPLLPHSPAGLTGSRAGIADGHRGAHFGPPFWDGRAPDCRGAAAGAEPAVTGLAGGKWRSDAARRDGASSWPPDNSCDRLPTPQLIVPGNHDIPLFDVVRRFVAPLRRYCRLITNELNPLLPERGDDGAGPEHGPFIDLEEWPDFGRANGADPGNVCTGDRAERSRSW